MDHILTEVRGIGHRMAAALAAAALAATALAAAAAPSAGISAL